MRNNTEFWAYSARTPFSATQKFKSNFATALWQFHTWESKIQETQSISMGHLYVPFGHIWQIAVAPASKSNSRATQMYSHDSQNGLVRSACGF